MIPAQLVEQLSTALARWERLALDLEEGRLEVVAGPVTKRRFHRGWRHHPSASRARRRRRCRSPGRSGRGDTTPIVIPTHGRVRVPDRRRLQHAGGQADAGRRTNASARPAPARPRPRSSARTESGLPAPPHCGPRRCRGAQVRSTLASILRRNDTNSLPRCRACSDPMIVPLAMSSAAYKPGVPLRHDDRGRGDELPASTARSRRSRGSSTTCSSPSCCRSGTASAN